MNEHDAELLRIAHEAKTNAARGHGRTRHLACACSPDRIIDLIERLKRAEALLREIDAGFVGREPEGAPAADGAYWLGHSLALRIHDATKEQP